MNRILVIYASHFGQTRAIALRIAEQLRERGAHVDLIDAGFTLQIPEPAGYDAVILGSRVEVGRHAQQVVDYMHRHRDVLERMPTGFFSVSMAAALGGDDPHGYVTALLDKLGWKPTCHTAFAGGLPYRKYSWFMRLVMKRISRAAGHTTDTSRNHELTNWDAVRAFADEVYARLPGQVVARRTL